MSARRGFTRDEAKRMKVSMEVGPYGTRNVALFVLGMHTGFRVKELLSLRRKNLVEVGKMVNEIYIERRFMKGKKECVEGRSADLFDETKAVLRELLDWLYQRGFMQADDLIFQNSSYKNKAMTAGRATQIVQAASRRCRITGPIGTHSWRKTYAQNLYEYCCRQEKELGLDPVEHVRQALGHKDRKTTERYLDLRRINIKPLIRGAVLDEA